METFIRINKSVLALLVLTSIIPMSVVSNLYAMKLMNMEYGFASYVSLFVTTAIGMCLIGGNAIKYIWEMWEIEGTGYEELAGCIAAFTAVAVPAAVYLLH